MTLSYNQKQTALAERDIYQGFSNWRMWLLLAYQDIKLRYRRSAIGPFWITLSMAVTIYSMGFLYGHLLHTDLSQYFPFLAAGMLAWSLISNSIIELSEAFIHSDNFIKQIKLPFTVFILRVVSRNFIVFLHNIVVMIPILIIFHNTVHINFNTLFLLIGLAIFIINSLCFGLLLALLGARYRDVNHVIKSLMQVVFFITPVMWAPNHLPASYQHILYFNPFYAYVEIIREPLLGQIPSWPVLVMCGLLTIIGAVLAVHTFIKSRARIVYWL